MEKVTGHRRKARECALQVLYEMEMKDTEPHRTLESFWLVEDAAEDVRVFATELVEGTYRNRKEIDVLVERHSLHWKLARMAVVDRNILRLAAYELISVHDVPMSVILNEAIEIAKKLGTGDSSAFINGILDKVGKEVRK